MVANYHCHINVVSRGKGLSAVGGSAYRAREKIREERTGVIHDDTVLDISKRFWGILERLKGILIKGVWDKLAGQEKDKSKSRLKKRPSLSLAACFK